jgi:hemerythrin-like domain-containing protein
MRYASEDLRAEHEGILTGLEVLERIADAPHGGHAPGSAELAEMVGFFRLFADKCHHGKEEAMYFPALVAAGVGEGVAHLAREHREGRERITRMESALASGDAAHGEFAQAAREYAAALREHIREEDTRLFPEGDRAIPREVQEDLLRRFEQFEEEVIGAGTHGRLHAMLDGFRRKYGGEQGHGHGAGHAAHGHGGHTA